MDKAKLNIKDIPGECRLKHKELDIDYNFTTTNVHKNCCDQCKHACTNGFYAPSMWCVKHKTNDGQCFMDGYGGTTCEDFEEGTIWDYYIK